MARVPEDKQEVWSKAGPRSGVASQWEVRVFVVLLTNTDATSSDGKRRLESREVTTSAPDSRSTLDCNAWQ